MTIGIDASRALRPIKTGTEWYSVEIIRNLTTIDQKNQYVLYSNIEPTAPLDDLPKNVTWRVMPFPRGWTLLRLSLEMRRQAPDVLFIPAHTLPLITPKKTVVMVHDLGFKHNPELYPMRQKVYHNFVVNYIKKKATAILTPSQFTKDDIVNTLGVNPDKISVVPHGYDENLYQPRQDPAHRSAEMSPYIFYIGRLETKKNVINLVEAFKKVKENVASEAPIKLVLAGKPSHGYENIKQKIATLGNFSADVVELGYVPEEELPMWFSNAMCFAFPTLFEGFGFPIIQAMACGTPVVCSNTTSLPEIASDAALLVNPRNSDEIANSIIKILTDSKLQQELKTKGLKNAKRFSWQKAAEQTLEVIEKVGNTNE